MLLRILVFLMILGFAAKYFAASSTRDMRNELRKLTENDFIAYPAETETKGIIYVVSDVNCPACRSMHSQLNIFTQNGIEVRYLLVSVIGGDRSLKTEIQVWCSKNRKQALNQAMQGVQSFPSESCESPIIKLNDFIYRHGIHGTPTLIFPDGELASRGFALDEVEKHQIK